jgi:hypothetical protein
MRVVVRQLLQSSSIKEMKQEYNLLALLAIGQLLGLLVMTERPAKAYVDPGSGLLTLQMLGASVAGGFFFLRHKLKKLMARRHELSPVEVCASAPATGERKTVQLSEHSGT